jgi:hypothetical protein
MASVEWKSWEEGYLTVTYNEPPPDQVSSGLSGLLPVSGYFDYFADPEKGELRGRVSGISFSEGMANQAIGPLMNLQKIEIDLEDGRSIACTQEIVQSDPEWITWDFACPAGKPGEDTTYRYPFRMTFTNQINPTYVVSGELFGYWQQGMAIPAVPYPEEIGIILQASPGVSDLLSDHQVFAIRPVAAVDPVVGLSDHHWKAEVALLGQAQIDERILPYSVTIQVEIEDSRLVHWDLDRSELNFLLQDAFDQAITRRFLDGEPDLVLNLFYGEWSADLPEDPIIEESLQSCAGLTAASQSPAPSGQALPAPGQPFRGFAFNQPWSIHSAQILLLEGGLRVNELHISGLDPDDALWISLLPPELQPQDAPPFRSISTSQWRPGVKVYWDMSSSLAEDELYYAMFKNWDVTRDTEYHGITLNQAMLSVASDGRLALVNCRLP